MLVPGVAFDPYGYRIGYGGGYYDRLLPLLRRDVRRVSGAFELQVVDRVPTAPHDLTVDAIVTERPHAPTATAALTPPFRRAGAGEHWRYTDCVPGRLACRCAAF